MRFIETILLVSIIIQGVNSTRSIFSFLPKAVAYAYPSAESERNKSNSSDPMLYKSGEGIQIDLFAKTVLPGFELQQKRHSEVGIGYHFYYKHPKQGTSLLVTIGIFSTQRQAQEAAQLSHNLMPLKPKPLENLADEAWFFSEARGSAVRFRLGRMLFRIGGNITTDEAINLAVCSANYLTKALPNLRVDDVEGFPNLTAHNIPRRMDSKQRAFIELDVKYADQKRVANTGIWASDGNIKATESTDKFVFQAPNGTTEVMLRCFATFEDGCVAIQNYRIEVTK